MADWRNWPGVFSLYLHRWNRCGRYAWSLQRVEEYLDIVVAFCWIFCQRFQDSLLDARWDGRIDLARRYRLGAFMHLVQCSTRRTGERDVPRESFVCKTRPGILISSSIARALKLFWCNIPAQ